MFNPVKITKFEVRYSPKDGVMTDFVFVEKFSSDCVAVFRKVLGYFRGELNDILTQALIEREVARSLPNVAVLCDETTNPVSVIDRSQVGVIITLINNPHEDITLYMEGG
jgi:hypothetical protein